jgi:hypothetical protein
MVTQRYTVAPLREPTAAEINTRLAQITQFLSELGDHLTRVPFDRDGRATRDIDLAGNALRNPGPVQRDVDVVTRGHLRDQSVFTAYGDVAEATMPLVATGGLRIPIEAVAKDHAVTLGQVVDEIDGGKGRHTLLGPRHSDAATQAVTRGSLVVGSASPAWDELLAGASATVFQMDGAGDPGWVTVSGDATIAAGGAVTLADTAVTPATYGDAANVGQFTVDSKGRITAAADVPIDHGSVAGLGDDDHTQYILADGTRAFTAYIDIDEAAAPGTPAANVMRLYAEDFHGFPFLSFKDDGGQVRKLVRDSVFLAYNNRGTTIASGRIVYATGAFGDVPTVDTAKADAGATMPAIGVTVESIANNSYGRVMQIGLLEDVNTSAFSAGDVLYVSATTAGVPTATAPLWPNLRQEIGTVLVSDAAVGSIQLIARTVQNDGVVDHGGLLGLVDDDHTQYALLAGRAGGQTLQGGTDSGDDFVLESTSHATKGVLQLIGGQRVRRTAVNNAASPYAVLEGDYYIGVDTSGGAVTINLQAAATAAEGKVLIVKDESGDAGASNITVDPNGTEQIDEGGAGTPVTISSNFGSITLITDGSNWFLV